MASFEHETAISRRLLETLALPCSNVADPKRVHGRETGADVQIEVGDRIVGVQVTEFTTDEGLVHPERGLRATERRVAAKVRIASRHDFKEFAEVWLLVAASVAAPDRVVSTFIVPPALSVEGLNDDLDDKLRRSKYSRAFVHLQSTEWCTSGRRPSAGAWSSRRRPTRNLPETCGSRNSSAIRCSWRKRGRTRRWSRWSAATAVARSCKSIHAERFRARTAATCTPTATGAHTFGG
jgi:hypothetical protein